MSVSEPGGIIAPMTTEVTTRGARTEHAPARWRWTPRGPLHLGQTLRVLGRGAEDPTCRILGEDCVWITTRWNRLPVSARFTRPAGATGTNPLDRDVLVEAWGPGGEGWLSTAPRWVGHEDSWEDFDSSAAFSELPHTLVRARHEHPGLRLPATGNLLERAVVAILEQRVTAVEAVRAYRALLRWNAESAPGPAPHGMRVPPTPEQWRRTPSWQWHRAGVDPARSATVMRTMHRAAALERLALDPDPARVRTALQSIQGIGPWTAAEITECTHGDPDGVSVHDYHLADYVCWFFDHAPGSDERMLELLEPWRGHRQRVVRLIKASGHRKPSFGPRLSPQDHRQH